MGDTPRKVAYVFPGQGVQSVGMGRDLAAGHPAAAEMLRRADSALGFRLTSLCYEGPEETLRDTVNAQPAIVAVSLAAFAAVRAAGGPAPDMLAGHSLGEYSALIAAGAIAPDAGLRLVRRRGELMAEAAAARGGTMAAVVGLEEAALDRLCAADPGTVLIANRNSPGQYIISGEADAVGRVGDAAKAAGAKRIVPLAVAGAFHSPLMEPAAEGMAVALADVPFRPPSVPVYSNVTARPVPGAGDLPALLARQIVSGVRWEETVRHMVADGAAVFIECGPGKVLRGLIHRIEPSVVVYNVQDSASLKRALATTKGEEGEA